MSTITGEIQIAAPREKVWAILTDLPAVQYYNPGVTQARWNSSTREGVGAGRHCDFRSGLNVEERIAAWQPGEYVVIELYAGSAVAPISNGRARLTLDRATGGGTAVTMQMAYEPKYGLIGKLMDALMIRKGFRQGIAEVLGGLKHYAETGEPVNGQPRNTALVATAVA